MVEEILTSKREKRMNQLRQVLDAQDKRVFELQSHDDAWLTLEKERQDLIEDIRFLNAQVTRRTKP